jgi:hypothetical protein
MSEERILMDCAQFEDILADLGRPGTRGVALRESALAHAESCRRCAELLAEAESLNLALRALARQEAGRQASSRVETNLLSEFREREAVVSRRRVRWQAAAIGVAAAILLALGISLHHRLAPSPDSGSVAKTPTGLSAPLAGNSGEAAGTVEIQGSGSNSAATGGRGPSFQSAPSSEQSDSGYTAAFIPLRYAADPAAADEGAIIRVVLSRSALASLGLPVTEIASEERVRADLVVSEDGTPQAIRVVSQESAGRDF